MTICFFDLDNTLLDHEIGRVPDSALLGLDRLRERGTLIVLSTGRDMDTHYSVRYLDSVRPDAIIHQNGTRVSVGGIDIFRHYMDRDFLREIYDFCLDQHICVGTSIGDEDFYLYPELKTWADLSYKKRSVRNYVPFTEIFERDIPVQALAMAGDMNVIKPMVEERFPTLDVFPFSSGGVGADVVEKDFSKAKGLIRICEYYGADIADTYAFGDSSNDVAILRAAGTGVAVGGADPEALAAADYVTDEIGHDGIYNALVHFGLI